MAGEITDSINEIDDTERTRQIRRVLSHYDDSFTSYLAVTISLTESLPEEMNNQIRNAFTHLARAQKATTLKAFNEQLDRSIGHIDRASRDCLKASIIVAHERLNNLIADAIFYHVALTPIMKAKNSRIIELRQEAYRAETQGKSEVVGYLEDLLRQTIDLTDQIIAEYSVAGKKKTKFLRFFYRWSRPFLTLGALIAGYALHPLTQPLFAMILAAAKDFMHSHFGY